MPEWLVRLDGDQDDLRLLTEYLSADPSVKEEEDGYWLRFTGFNSLTEATKVHELALTFVGEIRGVVKLLSGGTLKVEVVGLAQENYAGTRPQYAFLEGVESDQRFGMSTDTFLQWLAIANQNPAISKALNFYQRGDWFNLYKAWEAVAEGVGGEHVLIQAKGWTTKKEKDRFTNTVNRPTMIGDEARHAVEKGNPPTKPMSIDEARDFVGRLIEAWIREEDI